MYIYIYICMYVAYILTNNTMHTNQLINHMCLPISNVFAYVCNRVASLRCSKSALGKGKK